MNLNQIVVATTNQGKLTEIKDSLTDIPVELIALSNSNISAPDENGLSFHENAIIKARYYAQELNCSVLADDSGLCVEGLDNQPGIYSSRFSAMATDSDNNHKLVQELQAKNLTKSKAYYCCVLALFKTPQDTMPIIASGVIYGEVVLEPQGNLGFGYDPHFYLPQLDKTVAQIDCRLKNFISHRGQAMLSLKQQLLELLKNS